MNTTGKTTTRAKRATTILGACLLVAGLGMTAISVYALIADVPMPVRNPLIGLMTAAGGYCYCRRDDRSRLLGTALTIAALVLWRVIQ